MDKITLKFLADILYIKGFIYHEEYEDIMSAQTISDLDYIVDRMLRDGYKPSKTGEGYVISDVSHLLY